MPAELTTPLRVAALAIDKLEAAVVAAAAETVAAAAAVFMVARDAINASVSAKAVTAAIAVAAAVFAAAAWVDAAAAVVAAAADVVEALVLEEVTAPLSPLLTEARTATPATAAKTTLVETPPIAEPVATLAPAPSLA